MFKTFLIKNVWQKVIIATVMLLSCSIIQVNAIETNIAMHQGSESDTQGFSIAVSDKVTKSSNFYWGVGYSNFDDVKVEWNQRDLFFKVDTIDVIASYRYQPKSYNSFMKKLTLEYQLGASFALTENKFLWPELNEEKVFSDKGDFNPFIGFATHYSFSKNSALNLGFKYQPSFSDLDDITSVYIGFTYKFGKQVGY